MLRPLTYGQYQLAITSDELAGLSDDELAGIGSFFKKLGKGVAKVAPVAAGFIPGVGPVAQQLISAGAGLIPTGGGTPNEEKLRKDCAKKPSKKGCAELRAADEQRAAVQAQAQAEATRQQQLQQQQIDLLQRLAERDAAAPSNGGGGFDNQTLLIAGGVGVGLLAFLMLSR